VQLYSIDVRSGTLNSDVRFFVEGLMYKWCTKCWIKTINPLTVPNKFIIIIDVNQIYIRTSKNMMGVGR
jgi:hypothetical protein